MLETLGPLPPDRKCFRMINGVLVERTVNDVTPALQTNAEGLKKVLEELVKQYKRQQDEMEKWKVGIKGRANEMCLLTQYCTEEEQYTGRPAVANFFHPRLYRIPSLQYQTKRQTKFRLAKESIDDGL